VGSSVGGVVGSSVGVGDNTFIGSVVGGTDGLGDDG